MPRSFELSADYQDSVQEVLRAFTEPDYWAARLAASGVDESKVESLEVADDGTIKVATLQMIKADKLAGVFSQLVRGDIRIKRQETWTRDADGTATATIAGSVPGAPANVTGTAELTPDEATGCRLGCELVVQVKIPLIGGKLEKMVGAQLVNLVAAEQRFTSEWITNKA
jgi:hypothetical protein